MRTWLRILAWVGGIVGVVLLILYIFVFDVWTVPSDDPLLSASIEPTLSAGDVVLLSRHTDVARGNLVRCADPQAPGRFIIARAIGRYGDNLTITNEVVAIDAQRNPSPRACDPPTMTLHDPNSNEDVELVCAVEEYGEMAFSALRTRDHPEPPTKAEVQAGRWYLVSDDRHIHLDSRDFGQIDPSTCLHIDFRLVSKAGFWDAKKRLTIIW